jgi:type VI secretion system protein ImpC
LRRTLGEQSPALRILHLPKAQLLLDVVRAESPEESTLGRTLIDSASSAEAARPSLVLGLYDFGCDDHDVVLLHALSTIGAAAGVPFIAAANASFLGCRSFADLPSADALRRRWAEPALDQWRAVRALPSAGWLALAAPRWLCRVPFNEDVNGLSFREGLDAHRDALLWAHPAWLVAAALVEERSIGDFSREVQIIDGLPLHTHKEDGEIVATPCAETWMTDAQVQALADGGILPLVSYRGRDAIALPRLQSVAEPATPLAPANRAASSH